MIRKPLLAAAVLLTALIGRAAEPTILSRQVAVRDYCAWPNVIKLPDGTPAAVVFNRPTHGREEGEVECWTSRDGKTWAKAGTPLPHEPGTNRMNVAAGLNARGEWVVLSSGWTLKPDPEAKGRLKGDRVLRTASAISADGGKTWKATIDAFPPAPASATEYIPFGKIFPAGDGSLRATAYVGTSRDANEVFMFRSTDDGATWKVFAPIAKDHNETALFPVGPGAWLAAARRLSGTRPTDLFRSDDDGKTWTLAVETVGGDHQHPADLLRLTDGRLLLSLGQRRAGKHGVGARLSVDDGKTWGPLLPLVTDAAMGDCGYPSSVQLADGTVVTGYYAKGTPLYAGYQFSTVLWTPPPAK
jgi:hypothetical protein